MDEPKEFDPVDESKEPTPNGTVEPEPPEPEWCLLYSCRRCDEVDMVGSVQSTCMQAVLAIASTGAYPHGLKYGIRLHRVHACEDGGYGLSDFVGTEPVVEKPETKERQLRLLEDTE
jgi:hypothetical protein